MKTIHGPITGCGCAGPIVAWQQDVTEEEYIKLKKIKGLFEDSSGKMVTEALKEMRKKKSK